VKAAAEKLGHPDATRQRQLLLADRLLARISQELGEGVVAKGGIALELRLRHARATQDLDLHVSGRSEGLLERLQAAARADLGDLLSFAGVPLGRYQLYPRELHVAEKLHAYTMPRPLPNGRVKDLPDLALLAQTGAFDASTLRAAIARTFEQRATHSVPAALPPPPAEFWKTTYARMARVNQLPWPGVDDVLAAAAAFLDPVLGGTTAVRWNPAVWSWEG
jgi:hypothetical protein